MQVAQTVADRDSQLIKDKNMEEFDQYVEFQEIEKPKKVCIYNDEQLKIENVSYKQIPYKYGFLITYCRFHLQSFLELKTLGAMSVGISWYICFSV